MQSKNSILPPESRKICPPAFFMRGKNRQSQDIRKSSAMYGAAAREGEQQEFESLRGGQGDTAQKYSKDIKNQKNTDKIVKKQKG